MSVSAQAYLAITAGDNRERNVTLHHVKVENLTKEWECTLNYPDTVLTMSGVGVDGYDEEAMFVLQKESTWVSIFTPNVIHHRYSSNYIPNFYGSAK